jgi:hypothetical protein
MYDDDDYSVGVPLETMAAVGTAWMWSSAATNNLIESSFFSPTYLAVCFGGTVISGLLLSASKSKVLAVTGIAVGAALGLATTYVRTKSKVESESSYAPQSHTQVITHNYLPQNNIYIFKGRNSK